VTREVHEHDPPLDQLSPEQEAELVLAKRLGDDAHLIDLVKFGADMEQWAQTKVGEYFVNRAEEELSDAVRALLEQSDLASAAAKGAHLKGRTALAVLRWMDEAITSGREASNKIISEDVVDRPPVQ
jgi:hypothetical protein